MIYMVIGRVVPNFKFHFVFVFLPESAKCVPGNFRQLTDFIAIFCVHGRQPRLDSVEVMPAFFDFFSSLHDVFSIMNNLFGSMQRKADAYKLQIIIPN